MLKWLVYLAAWALALVVWLYFSAFVHEFFHLVAADAAGFEIKDCCLLTIPGKTKGYVDVIIKKGTTHYYLKRGLMHLAGVLAHVLLIIVAALLFLRADSILWQGIWFAGLVVNCYMVVMNTFPETSDGRQFWDLMRRRGR